MITNNVVLMLTCYKTFIMEVLIGVSVLIVFMYVMGWAFQKDLKDMNKTHPKFRKHLKDKHDL